MDEWRAEFESRATRGWIAFHPRFQASEARGFLAPISPIARSASRRERCGADPASASRTARLGKGNRAPKETEKLSHCSSQRQGGQAYNPQAQHSHAPSFPRGRGVSRFLGAPKRSPRALRAEAQLSRLCGLPFANTPPPRHRHLLMRRTATLANLC